jgi:hypothetical protein
VKPLHINDVALVVSDCLKQRPLPSPDQPHALCLGLVEQPAANVPIKRFAGRSIKVWLKLLPLKEPSDHFLGSSAPIYNAVAKLLDGFGYEAINRQNDEPGILFLQTIARKTQEPTI